MFNNSKNINKTNKHPLTLYHWTQQHHDIYVFRNPCPVLVQALKCDGVKPVYGLREARINTASGTSFNSKLLIFRNVSILYILASKL